MSRIIKFRVWDGEKQKMFPVRELFWRTNPYEMVGNYWDFRDEHDQYGAAVYFPHTDAHGKHENFILMQFTGLKDKHGKEVYDGDVYRNLDNGLVGKFYYLNGPGGYALHCRENNADGYPHNMLPFAQLDTTNFEVIGNIYEHPELIGVAK